MAPTTPFTLTTTGRTTIPHPAERACLHLPVTSTGPNKAAAADDVQTTTQHIETMLRELSPPDPPPQGSSKDHAKAAAPLAHWSKTGLSATSYVPYNTDARLNSVAKARQYTAKITFDIRFQHFGSEMAAFGSKVSTLPHAEISRIDWILTAPTRKSYEGRLRREAARDALEKAKDYCEVLGCGAPRPVELTEGREGGYGGMRMGSNDAMPMMQSAPAGPVRGGGGMGAGGERDESPVEFTPKEVRMSMDVTIKFNAFPDSDNGGQPLAKRARVDDTAMEDE